MLLASFVVPTICPPWCPPKMNRNETDGRRNGDCGEPETERAAAAYKQTGEETMKGLNMNDNMKNFLKEAEANEELRTKIEALEGADDAIEKVIAIAAEYGYALTEEDFKEGGDAALSLDDLDSVAGGISLQEKLFGFTRIRNHKCI